MDSGRALSGKTCLVTGATSGIGAVTARALAEQGGRVILVGRSTEKCEATADRLRRETGNPSVDWLVADLSSQDEVRRLADAVRARYPTLDVLVNNAGAMFAPRRVSVDGIEMTWALNHLAYFLLTNLLLDLIRASAPSRIVSVASEAHRASKGINFEDVEGRHAYRPFRAYTQSKLANILFSNELARRLAGTGVTSNALHPGFVATNFFQGTGWVHRSMALAARLFAINPEQGARTSIYLASAPEVAEITGQYFVKCRSVPPSPAARDESTARRLWEQSERMTGLVPRE